MRKNKKPKSQDSIPSEIIAYLILDIAGILIISVQALLGLLLLAASQVVLFIWIVGAISQIRDYKKQIQSLLQLYHVDKLSQSGTTVQDKESKTDDSR